MKFKKIKSGIAICPFFIWTSENGLGHHEDDINLTFCNHPENLNECEGNCNEENCPLVKMNSVSTD